MSKRVFAGIILAGMPWLAAAQLLNFDAVCPSPPCPIGTLYASWGVAFAPNTTQIIAGDESQLNTSGRILSVSSFPYQLTISLARPANYFSLRLSRTSTSSGPVTVSATRLREGQMVHVPSTITLTNANEWTTLVSLGGLGLGPIDFDSLFIETSGGANQSIVIDKIQFSGQCYGFADVSPSDIFCNAAEWLANRGVTVGCATAEFCPSQNVTRAQMALFMQRLGDAYAPIFMTKQGAVPPFGPNNFVEENPVCIVDTIQEATYARWAWISAGSVLYSMPLAAPSLVAVKILVSTNGSPWMASGTLNKPLLVNPAAPGYIGDQALIWLFPGSTYRFALGIHFQTGSTVSGHCELHAQVVKQGGGPCGGAFLVVRTYPVSPQSRHINCDSAGASRHNSRTQRRELPAKACRAHQGEELEKEVGGNHRGRHADQPARCPRFKRTYSMSSRPRPTAP